MSGHIFLSYSRKDKARAKQLAETFENIGWDVWWDREIPPGQSFDDVIEEALIGASCIVVLWSKNSVHSQWVKTEAAEGKRRRILIPIQIDELDALPLAFRRTQVAPLINWNGSIESEDFKLIVASMSPFMSKHNIDSKQSVNPATPITPVIKPTISPSIGKAASAPTKPENKQPRRFPFKLLFMSIAVILLAAIAYKTVDMMSNNTPSVVNKRIMELEEKQRQLEKALADKNQQDKNNQDETKRIEQEKELKALQVEKQRLIDLERERKALEEEKQRQAELDEKKRLRQKAIDDKKKQDDAINTQQPENNLPSGGWYVVTASPSLKVRTLPRKSGKRIGLIPYGEKIRVNRLASNEQTIAGKIGYWVEITYKQQKAYVFSAFLQPVNATTPSVKQEYIVLASPSLTIRGTPEVAGVKKGKVKKGRSVEFISKASALQTLDGKQGYWFKIKYGNTTGYAFSAYLRKK